VKVGRQADLGLRLILATRILDRAYARLDRLRSLAVLSLAPDAALDRFNDWAYSESDAYRRGSAAFRRGLFPWEEDVLRRFFPTPPARVLVGGAGAGREPVALAALGYDVVAFEPVSALAGAASPSHGGGVQWYRAGYEDLPALESVEGGHAARLSELGPFDGAVFGWGSFTHLRTHADRSAALKAIADVTRGPILVSFIAVRASRGSRPRRIKSWLLARRGREPWDDFSIHMGFRHPVSEEEVTALADEVGLGVLELEFRGGETFAPYAVLRPAEATV
jgi:hypothetical protein